MSGHGARILADVMARIIILGRFLEKLFIYADFLKSRFTLRV